MTLEEKEKQIIDHYGLRHQLQYLFGEIFELMEAIIEQELYISIEPLLKDGHKVDRQLLHKHTTDEFADVEHLLDQIALKLEIVRDEVLKVKEFKADRQLQRIKTGGFNE